LTAAVLLSPLRTLFGKSADETLWAYCWAFLIGLYVIIYYVVPANFLNTYQGFKSGWVSVLWSLGIFFILVATWILWMRKSACQTKIDREIFFSSGRKGQSPEWLKPTLRSVSKGKYV
jgi:hypothetical protein